MPRGASAHLNLRAVGGGQAIDAANASVLRSGRVKQQGLGAACLVLEFVVFAQDPSKEIGDFGDPFGVGMMSPEMRDREINNGRMAMFATIGILVAELATGKDGVEQLGLP